MASLTIRNIPEDAKRRFRRLAAANGRSMEEEARQMIIAKTASNDDRPSIWDMLYGASRPGVDLPIPPRTAARIPDFE